MTAWEIVKSVLGGWAASLLILGAACLFGLR